MPIRMTFLDLAAFIWMAGCLGFLSVHLLSYLHWKRRIVKEGSYTVDSGIQSIFLELKKELQIRRAVPVIVFHAAPSPMIMGFWRSFLVLPQERYSQEELFFILKHELMHLKEQSVISRLRDWIPSMRIVPGMVLQIFRWNTGTAVTRTPFGI